MTATQRRRILELARAHPDWTLTQIARAVGVHPARVSEALGGKRRIALSSA